VGREWPPNLMEIGVKTPYDRQTQGRGWEDGVGSFFEVAAGGSDKGRLLYRSDANLEEIGFGLFSRKGDQRRAEY